MNNVCYPHTKRRCAGNLCCLTDLLNHFLCRFVMLVLAHWEAALLWEEEEVRQEEGASAARQLPVRPEFLRREGMLV